MPYIPHTAKDKDEMQQRINAPLAALFDEIPSNLFCAPLNMAKGMNEMEMLKEAARLAHLNQNDTCFIGAGAYEHHIPAAVWDIASRGEFLTAYTPYQAEASQGTLQLLYEFQTMIAELTGMDVANASLYDGATALAEAALMAVRIKTKSQRPRILVAGTLHPFYRQTLETIVRNQHIEVITLPFEPQSGVTPMESLDRFKDENITALVIPQPNFFGCLEAVDTLTDWAHAHGVVSIAVVNPISLGLLKPPGQYGAKGVDIACGEGQPLGCPLASGGPYFGFFSTRLQYVRQMPGRLIGRTLDKEGKEGFTLTLQAREQHIRRAKATSNICTNQGLLTIAATIHMSLLGAEGLKKTALACHHNTQALVNALTDIPGVERVFNTPYFHEVVLTLPKPTSLVLTRLHQQGVAGGYALDAHFPSLHNALLVCATEMRTKEDILHYQQTLKSILTES